MPPRSRRRPQSEQRAPTSPSGKATGRGYSQSCQQKWAACRGCAHRGHEASGEHRRAQAARPLAKLQPKRQQKVAACRGCPHHSHEARGANGRNVTALELGLSASGAPASNPHQLLSLHKNKATLLARCSQGRGAVGTHLPWRIRVGEKKSFDDGKNRWSSRPAPQAGKRPRKKGHTLG